MTIPGVQAFLTQPAMLFSLALLFTLSVVKPKADDVGELVLDFFISSCAGAMLFFGLKGVGL